MFELMKFILVKTEMVFVISKLDKRLPGHINKPKLSVLLRTNIQHRSNYSKQQTFTLKQK